MAVPSIASRFLESLQDGESGDDGTTEDQMRSVLAEAYLGMAFQSSRVILGTYSMWIHRGGRGCMSLIIVLLCSQLICRL